MIKRPKSTTITRMPTEGCTRCWCGAKYWDGIICHSCGETFDPAMEDEDR